MKNEDPPSNIYLDDAFSYNKKMGAYKPEFEAIPDDYYPLNAS